MPSPIRIDIPNVVYEVTIRCFQERFLLRPSEELNDLIWGAIGRAQHIFPEVQLYDLVTESNHYHSLMSCTDGASRAPFLQYVNQRISFEAGRLHGWKGGIFCRPARPIPCVTKDDQLARFRYLRSHGVKENLVERAEDWPGVSALPFLRHGEPIVGTFVWRDALTKARRRAKGKPVDETPYKERYPVHFSKLPALAHLSWEEIHAYTDTLTNEIEAEYAEKRSGKVLGCSVILNQHPHNRPSIPKKSSAPIVHCQDRTLRKRFLRFAKDLSDALRAANRELKKGIRDTVFPAFCHPARLPYVSWQDAFEQPGGTGATQPHALVQSWTGNPGTLDSAQANAPPTLLELLESIAPTTPEAVAL